LLLHTDRPSSAEFDSLSAEKDMLEQFEAGIYLMSGDMGDFPVTIELPLGPRARGRSTPATPIANERL
jgi:hypothetical protein